MAKAKAAEAVPEKKAKKADPKMLGTKDMAAKLKTDPKTLRAVLRAMGDGSDHKRYSWPADADPSDLQEAIDKWKAEKKASREKAAKKNAKAEPAAKKTAKAKSAKKAKDEDEDEELDLAS